jgi:hypothetical protein
MPMYLRSSTLGFIVARSLLNALSIGPKQDARGGWV